mmetsp:Transcript_25614/g.84601  ORF Transcript_25614/g.84601 Transcript_25614/m.84601 type:complete len:965 (-) Transcript_25614:260-3154(-)
MSFKAKNPILELLNTEISYTRSLKTMLEVYFTPLRNAQYKLSPILQETLIDTIFGNAEDLFVIADQLRVALDRRIKSTRAEEVPKVGDIMYNIAPLLKLYQRYVSHYERASQCYFESKEKVKEFALFLEKAQMNHESSVLSLDSYLIMPVQRIPRYKLLLEEILKYTPEDAEDYEDLRRALNLISEQADQCNEATRRRENTEKLRSIQKNFPGIDLVDPERKIIREGKLTRITTKEPKEYYFYLFNDALIYAQEVQLGVLKQMKLKRKFDIGNRYGMEVKNKLIHGGRMIKVEEISNPAESPLSWEVFTSQKSFKVRASTEEEKTGWFNDMKEALREAEQFSMMGIAAPVYGTVTKACQICSSRFGSISKKRFNCRKCGLYICGRCSLSMEENGCGHQGNFLPFALRIITVHNEDLIEWHRSLLKQSQKLDEKVGKVRVCHRCMYGKEYNRKSEFQYLSWIKANKLYNSQGYINFKKQPDKQLVIKEYQLRERNKEELNGVEIVESREHVRGLGLIANQYEVCSSCQSILLHCRCNGAKCKRAGSGELSTPRTWTSSSVDESMMGQGLDGAETRSNGSSSEGATSSDEDYEEHTASGELFNNTLSEEETIVLFRVRAWCDFAGGENQLQLEEGDVVSVLQEANEDGWCYGRSEDGEEGYFPSSYVEALEADEELWAPPPPARPPALRQGEPADLHAAHAASMAQTLLREEQSEGCVSDQSSSSNIPRAQSLEDVEARIVEAQRQWEEDIKRRSPRRPSPERKPEPGKMGQILNFLRGKAPEPQLPVSNPEPLSIIHLGSAVALPAMQEAQLARSSSPPLVAGPEATEGAAHRRKSGGNHELVQKQIEKNMNLFQQDQARKETKPPADPPAQPDHVHYAGEQRPLLEAASNSRPPQLPAPPSRPSPPAQQTTVPPAPHPPLPPCPPPSLTRPAGPPEKPNYKPPELPLTSSPPKPNKPIPPPPKR